MLRDHPALAGRDIARLWAEKRRERLAFISGKELAYSRQVQAYHRRMAVWEAMGAKGYKWTKPIQIQTPGEFAKSLCKLPPYPVGVYA